MIDESRLDLIERLIAFPTVSRDGNDALIAFLREYLTGHGARIDLFPHPTEPKANLLATIAPESAEAAARPGLMLSGHTDVVPVDGQAWSRDPFTPWRCDGRLYGRGACDMKGFLGLVLAQVPQIRRADLSRPLHLAFSYDEEVGCAGVRSLVDHLARMTLPPAMCIVGEPTGMTAVTGHKGIRVVRTTITGRPAHSSNPEEGANAAVAAGRLACIIADEAEALKTTATHADFHPPYTTVNVGRVEAGSAVNIIANHASVEWEYRPVPDSDADAVLAQVRRRAEAEILPDLRRTAPEADLRFEVVADAPAMARLSANPAEELVLRLLGSNETHCVPFATEAGLFQHQAGIPTVVCGPGFIDQAHKADEYVSFAQLEACDDFLTRLVAAV